MPVRQLRPRQSPNHQKLLQQIIAEWQNPNSSSSQPVILEEFDSSGLLVPGFVVWDEWLHIDRVERGEIVMEAAEKKYGNAASGSVTVAMGLTATEADQMGIDWQ